MCCALINKWNWWSSYSDFKLSFALYFPPDSPEVLLNFFLFFFAGLLMSVTSVYQHGRAGKLCRLTSYYDWDGRRTNQTMECEAVCVSGGWSQWCDVRLVSQMPREVHSGIQKLERVSFSSSEWLRVVISHLSVFAIWMLHGSKLKARCINLSMQ